MNVWVEKSKVRGRPDRISGDYALGRALWSPTRGKKGADVYRFMREVRPDDVVLHLTDDSAFSGLSWVEGELEEFPCVPNTEWMGDCYLVRLKNFTPLEPPLPKQVFFSPPYVERLLSLREQGMKNLFFDPGPRLHQGAYLTPAPPAVVSILEDAYQDISGRPLIPHQPLSNNQIGMAIDTEVQEEPEEAIQVDDVRPQYSLVDFSRDTGVPVEQLQRWVRAIERKGQAILYGPPGTGKTFVAELLAWHLIGGGNGFTELVQFHPAYAYEDFVLGIRPETKAGQLSYAPQAGRFVAFCDKAARRTGKCVLVIDEINRANLAQVFGELMYLLEYRDRRVALAGGRDLRVPQNVRIIGTMNTADRSIALMDYALRRRFAFLRLDPDYDLLARYHHATGFDPAGLITVLREVNAAVDDRNYELGISFFLLVDIEEQLEDVWRMEIEPYLEEYFFDDLSRAEPFSWERVRHRLMQ